MKIAIFGLGTVGSGVLEIIQRINKERKQKGESLLEVTHVFAREVRNKQLDLNGITVTTDIDEILDSGVELIVEVLGGIDLPLAIHRTALAKGIHLVTANKDLLALHIDELSQLANQQRAQIGYEASCAGGIPIIQPLQFNLNANKMTKLMGILNGTSNFVLTKMTEEQWSYEEALAEAQRLGYAEKDPTNDVSGLDSRRKIALLSRLAYQQSVDLTDIYVRGIEAVESKDIAFAKEKGYMIKLVGRSEVVGEQIMASVEPILLSVSHLLAHVSFEKNAVHVEGDAIGQALFYGPGAGGIETGSAVVSDILFIERFGFTGNLFPESMVSLTQDITDKRYYFRLANSVEEIQAQLDTLGIEITLCESLEEEVVIMTQPIHVETFEQLSNALNVSVYYHVEEGKY